MLNHPRFIEVHRLGTFPERSLDIDVVFDLMIHDLDLLLSIVAEPVVSRRSGRRAGADAADRHRQRAAAIRRRLHRQPHGQPHQPRPRAQDPVLPAPELPVDRLRRAGGRALDARSRSRRGRRRSRAGNSTSSKTNRCARARRLRRTRCATGGRRASPASRAALPCALRRRLWSECMMPADKTATIPDAIARQAAAGDRLDAVAVATLAVSTDILALGALADDARRRRHGDRGHLRAGPSARPGRPAPGGRPRRRPRTRCGSPAHRLRSTRPSTPCCRPRRWLAPACCGASRRTEIVRAGRGRRMPRAGGCGSR